MEPRARAGGAALTLAAALMAGCGGTREDRTAAADDPCRQMRREAETVESLEDQVRSLAERAYPDEERDIIVPDSAARVEAESLLAYKEEVLAQTIVAMNASARACDARSRPFNRYRTEPEREDRTF